MYAGFVRCDRNAHSQDDGKTQITYYNTVSIEPVSLPTFKMFFSISSSV